mmetsp:Transcript_48967/g.93579  ORF Transcript_48967/g.93579 Transcript_48967/m.93579 type:complete len:243 (-) Transcript_48967:73-801(-)
MDGFGHHLQLAVFSPKLHHPKHPHQPEHAQHAHVHPPPSRRAGKVGSAEFRVEGQDGQQIHHVHGPLDEGPGLGGGDELADVLHGEHNHAEHLDLHEHALAAVVTKRLLHRLHAEGKRGQHNHAQHKHREQVRQPGGIRIADEQPYPQPQQKHALSQPLLELNGLLLLLLEFVVRAVGNFAVPGGVQIQRVGVGGRAAGEVELAQAGAGGAGHVGHGAELRGFAHKPVHRRACQHVRLPCRR